MQIGIKMSRKYYGRYPVFVAPSIGECTLNDHQILYTEKTGTAFFNQVENIWCELEEFIKKELEADGNQCQELQVIGGEILKWVKKRDAYAVSLLLKLHPDFVEKYFYHSLSTKETATSAVSILLNTLSMKS